MTPAERIAADGVSTDPYDYLNLDQDMATPTMCLSCYDVFDAAPGEIVCEKCKRAGVVARQPKPETPAPQPAGAEATR